MGWFDTKLNTSSSTVSFSLVDHLSVFFLLWEVPSVFSWTKSAAGQTTKSVQRDCWKRKIVCSYSGCPGSMIGDALSSFQSHRCHQCGGSRSGFTSLTRPNSSRRSSRWCSQRGTLPPERTPPSSACPLYSYHNVIYPPWCPQAMVTKSCTKWLY